jgi:hypothetical protein
LVAKIATNYDLIFFGYYCLMHQIKAILDYFGFTIRELAELLGISHTLLIQMVQGQRSTPIKVKQLMAHPLFDIHDAVGKPEPEPVAYESGWLKSRIAKAEEKLLLEKRNQANYQKKELSARRIMHQAKDLDWSNLEKDDIVGKWWNWKRGKARQYIATCSPVKEWETDRKLWLLEKEIEFYQNKLRDIVADRAKEPA